MQKGFSVFYYTVIIFLLINSFYIVNPITSSMLAPLCALVTVCLFVKNKTLTTVVLLANRQVILLFISLMMMMSASLLIILINGTFDFSYLKNLLSQLIQAILVIATLALILRKNNYVVDNVEKLIIFSFVLQSLIQITAFLFPTFASIIHLTYSADKIARLYDDYGGVRGLALTGSPGWGLSVGYAISFLLYVKVYFVEKKVNLFSVFVGTLLVIGAFFAGRTAFIGVIVGVLYFFISEKSIIYKIKSSTKFVSIFLFFVVFSFFAMSNFWSLLIDRVFPFVFEFYYQYMDGGEVSTKSTDILTQMWDIDITLNQILLGTGLFTDPNTGEYFMGTDVGYLRNALYGGVCWVLIVFIYQCNILGLFNGTKIPSKEKKFIIMLLIMLSLMELKAMTVGFNKYLFTISVMIGVIYYLRYRRGKLKS